MTMPNQDGISRFTFSETVPREQAIAADVGRADYIELDHAHHHGGAADSDARYDKVLFVAYRNVRTNQETCKLCLDRGIR